MSHHLDVFHVRVCIQLPQGVKSATKHISVAKDEALNSIISGCKNFESHKRLLRVGLYDRIEISYNIIRWCRILRDMIAKPQRKAARISDPLRRNIQYDAAYPANLAASE